MGLNENGWPETSTKSTLPGDDYEAGKIDGYEEAVEDQEKSNIGFAVDNVKEAIERGLDIYDLLRELESEQCKFM